jgi:hypothetical protein
MEHQTNDFDGLAFEMYAESTDPGDADDGGTWVDLLIAGRRYPKYDGAAMGEGQYGLADFQEMLGNFETFAAQNGPPPVDANHATIMGKGGSDTELRAEVKALRVVGDKLQGLFQWTARGAQEIKDRAFRAVSSEVARVRDRITGKTLGKAIIGVTVTNRPLWSGLDAPQVLAEMARFRGSMVEPGSTSAETEEDPMADLISKLSEVHGEDLTEDKAAELFGEIPGLRKAAGDAEALKATNTELQAEVATLKADEESQKVQLTKLAEDFGALQAERATEREDVAIERDQARCAVSKSEAGSTDEPGIARRLYRTDAKLYADVYGVRPDNYATTGGEPTGTSKPAAKATDKPDTTGIATADAAEAYLVKGAMGHELYAEDPANYEKALTAFAEGLGDEGGRLLGLVEVM